MVTVTGYQAKTSSEGERKIYLQVEGGIVSNGLKCALGFVTFR